MLLLSFPAQAMERHDIRSDQDLVAVVALLAADRGRAEGHELVFHPGTFSALNLKTGADLRNIVVRSADPQNPARIARMDVRRVRGLVIEDIVFDYTFNREEPIYATPFLIWDVNDAVVRRVVFDGDVAQGVAAEDNGFGYAMGLSVRTCEGLTVEDVEFRTFHRGLVVHSCTDIVVRNNDLHDLRMDGMNFAQVERLLVENNRIRDFNRSLFSPDHADMIQIWTMSTTRPSRDITIRNNELNSGNGFYTQSIFMRNEVVDLKKAGPEMFYENVTIEGNVIVNSHINGISIGEVRGLVIANNTLIRNRRSQGPDQPLNDGLWTPQIAVRPASQNVRIERNAAWFQRNMNLGREWVFEDNVQITDMSKSSPGYYDKVFVDAIDGNPKDLANFRYLPDGPLGAPTAGSALLRP